MSAAAGECTAWKTRALLYLCESCARNRGARSAAGARCTCGRALQPACPSEAAAEGRRRCRTRRARAASCAPSLGPRARRAAVRAVAPPRAGEAGCNHPRTARGKPGFYATGRLRLCDLQVTHDLTTTHARRALPSRAGLWHAALRLHSRAVGHGWPHHASSVVNERKFQKPTRPPVTCGRRRAVFAPLRSPVPMRHARGGMKATTAAAAPPCVAALPPANTFRSPAKRGRATSHLLSPAPLRHPTLLRSSAAHACSHLAAPVVVAPRRSSLPPSRRRPAPKTARGCGGAQVPPRPPRASPAQPHDVPAAQLVAPPLSHPVAPSQTPTRRAIILRLATRRLLHLLSRASHVAATRCA